MFRFSEKPKPQGEISFEQSVLRVRRTESSKTKRAASTSKMVHYNESVNERNDEIESKSNE